MCFEVNWEERKESYHFKSKLYLPYDDGRPISAHFVARKLYCIHPWNATNCECVSNGLFECFIFDRTESPQSHTQFHVLSECER